MVSKPLSQIADSVFQTQHLVLSSSDRDEVVDCCTRALRPHQLVLHDKCGDIATRLHTLQLGPLSLNRLCYGGDVSVLPAVSEEDNFLVTLPVRGSANYTYGLSSVTLSEGHGAIVGPYQEFKFDLDAAFDQLVVRLDRQRIEAVCAGLLGTDERQPVNFNLALDTLPACWPGLIETAAAISEFSNTRAYPTLLVQLEELIVETLLLTQPNTFSDFFTEGIQRAPSTKIRRAADYMREHIAEPIRLTDVARHSGLSLRGLQLGFQRDLGTSPSQWLRSQRLEKVHEILSGAMPHSVSVTDVALDWGFSHLGEFAAQFKARYGKRPSDVLGKR